MVVLTRSRARLEAARLPAQPTPPSPTPPAQSPVSCPFTCQLLHLLVLGSGESAPGRPLAPEPWAPLGIYSRREQRLLAALHSWRRGSTTYTDPVTGLSRRVLPELYPDRFVRVFTNRASLEDASDLCVHDARLKEEWAARRAQEEFVVCSLRVKPTAKRPRQHRRGCNSSFQDLLARRRARGFAGLEEGRINHRIFFLQVNSLQTLDRGAALTPCTLSNRPSTERDHTERAPSFFSIPSTLDRCRLQGWRCRQF